MTAQGIVVGVIVLAAAAYLARRFYATVTGRKSGGCGCHSCPAQSTQRKSH